MKNIFAICMKFGVLPNDPRIYNLTSEQIAFIVEIINNI